MRGRIFAKHEQRHALPEPHSFAESGGGEMNALHMRNDRRFAVVGPAWRLHENHAVDVPRQRDGFGVEVEQHHGDNRRQQRVTRDGTWGPHAGP